MMSKAKLMTDLKRAIASGDEDQTHDAAVLVGDAGDEEAVPSLLSLLTEDPRVHVKNGAAIALRQLHANAAVPQLIKLIESPDFRHNRGTFVYALATLDWYSKYSSAVAKLIPDPNYEVRCMAVRALELAIDKMTRAQKGDMVVALSLSILGRLMSKSLTPDGTEAASFASQLLATKKMIQDTEFELVVA
jgi:HEAT repeat protein